MTYKPILICMLMGGRFSSITTLGIKQNRNRIFSSGAAILVLVGGSGVDVSMMSDLMTLMTWLKMMSINTHTRSVTNLRANHTWQTFDYEHWRKVTKP